MLNMRLKYRFNALIKLPRRFVRRSCRCYTLNRRGTFLHKCCDIYVFFAIFCGLVIVSFASFGLATDFINIIDPLDPLLYDEEISFDSTLPLCSNISKTFRGREPVSRISEELFDLEKMFPDIENGRLRPKDCHTYYRVAIIVPYRDRRKNLATYLYNVIPKLQRQRVDVTIFVAEQAPGSNFNRGMMKNIGFLEASKFGKFDCIVFNDVDTIPADDRNIFHCKKGSARHMVSSVDRFQNTIRYRQLFGGIVAIPPADFIKINGYSNLFLKWGSEDDNILDRSLGAGLRIERVYNPLGYVWSLSHERGTGDSVTFMGKVISTNIRQVKSDGLDRLVYKTLKVEKKKLFVWITAEVNEEQVLEAYKNIPWNQVTVTSVLRTIFAKAYYSW